MFDANFYDVETNEEHWISGPHRDGRDTRFSEDAREVYEAFLEGALLPGRE